MSQSTESEQKTKSEFVPSAILPSSFRNWIKADAAAEFAAEPNRYHLYVALACPWAHRALALIKLKGLEDVLSYSLVDGILDMESERGWAFGANFPDPHHPHFTHLKEVYLLHEPTYTGRVTVPVLFDLKRQKIVNNESSEIMRMLNGEFDAYARHPQLDLYPTALRAQIDSLNEEIFTKLNSGVYRTGFAKSQAVYEQTCQHVFEMLDKLESILSTQRYLIDDEKLTETDVRAWTTLIRFDLVYVTHFKCNKAMICKDYPNLFGFTREIYQMANLRDTVNFEEIKRHYYISHVHINPTGIVPLGPLIDYDAPHGREKRNNKQAKIH